MKKYESFQESKNFTGYFHGENIFVNTTPHEIRFKPENGEEFILPPSGLIVNGIPKEEIETEKNGIAFVKTVFEADKEISNLLDKASNCNNYIIFIGSIIAAQAYPGRVVALTPAKGYERVPVNEKRMNPAKFTVFQCQHKFFVSDDERKICSHCGEWEWI